MTFYFYTHTEIPISSKADEGESQLRQQEDLPSEVKENQAQKSRKLTPSAMYAFDSIFSSSLGTWSAKFGNVLRISRCLWIPSKYESYQAKLFDVMLYITQYQIVILFVSVYEILK